MEDTFEVAVRNLVAALPAGVFGGVRPDIHFTAAVAPREVAEGVGGAAARDGVKHLLQFGDE